MTHSIEIVYLDESLVGKIVHDLEGTNVARSENYLHKCLDESREGKRISLVALHSSKVAGFVNLIFRSEYPFFAEKDIPEINDLLVHPRYRRQGIGLQLITRVEEEAAKTYKFIGLGVGLYKDYGSAQRLYVKNGYIPDGRGIVYKNEEVKPGNSVLLDDDLLVYLYKEL